MLMPLVKTVMNMPSTLPETAETATDEDRVSPLQAKVAAIWLGLVTLAYLGTIVVEAPLKSGAMITAGLAGDYGREVMAVPGSVDSPLSRGPHQLLKDGARLVEVAEDVVEALGILLAAVPTERPRQDVAVSGDETAVLEALTYQPRHMDEVVAESHLATAQVSAALMMLEIKGLIKRFPGNAYVRL